MKLEPITPDKAQRFFDAPLPNELLHGIAWYYGETDDEDEAAAMLANSGPHAYIQYERDYIRVLVAVRVAVQGRLF